MTAGPVVPAQAASLPDSVDTTASSRACRARLRVSAFPGPPFRFLDRKLIAQTGTSKTAPAVPSKEMSSISSAAGLFLSLVMMRRW